MGLLTNVDAKIYRAFFKEMSALIGIKCEYRYVTGYTETIHSEYQYDLSEPEEMDIIFNENPLISTLRKFGWVSEDPEDKPYIAQLPYDAKNIQVGCTISINYKDLDSKRDFKITSMKSLLEYPDCWTCTLAPIFISNEPVKKHYIDKNYNYVLSKDSSIDNDAPDNNFGYLNPRRDISAREVNK